MNRRTPPRIFAVLLLVTTTMASAQSNLGELIDAGAKRITPDDFRRDIVGHPVRYQPPAGGAIEIVYIDSGRVAGRGFASAFALGSDPSGGGFAMGGGMRGGANMDVTGDWKTDDKERVCQSMRIGGAVMAQRCQFWFKLADTRYFVSDSESDRAAKVVLRTLIR